MLQQSGHHHRAELFRQRFRRLARAIHVNFWDVKAAIYRSIRSSTGQQAGRHELVQAIAISQGIGSAITRKKAAASLRRGGLVQCALVNEFALSDAMLNHSSESRSWMNHRLQSTWAKMAFSETSTMWETSYGADDFDYAGSLCHGWSALPVYYHLSSLLGVKPLEPGFRTFQVTPNPFRLSSLQGEVPTPYGPIHVSWEKDRGEIIIIVRAPKECRKI